MALNKEQQNLINDLKAPIKSFRIFALEETIKSGACQEVLQTLEELRLSEEDGECQILINHAISSVQQRLSGTATEPKALKEQQEFMEAWEKADMNGKLSILNAIPNRLPKGLRGMGPELLENQNASVVASKVIRVFCRYWPEDRFGDIVKCLNSDSLSLKLAALKTLVHMHPMMLINDLPELLNSKDAQIKALAIRGLTKIDTEEALKHLQALLLSPDISDRLAGIQNCPFLPFEMVKPVLLKYFSAENHPELLIRAGWILEMNPDVQVPFKLYEISERVPAKKAQLVKQIVSEAVKLLEKSGILGDKFQAYTQKLQSWVYKRNAIRFVKQVVAKLNSEHVDSDLEQVILNNLKQALIREAFTEALEWPIPAKIKEKINSYLKQSSATKPIASPEQATPEEVDKAAEVPEVKAAPKTEDSSFPTQEKIAKDLKADLKEVVSPEQARAETLEEKVHRFASLSLDELALVVNEIKGIIEGKDAPVDLRITALHTLTRHYHKGFEKLAVSLLSHPNVALATAALEYLGAVDPEVTFPYLGQCLKVMDVRMKSAALGILIHFDFNQAASSLNAMLKSREPEQQKMALECMDQFDFSLIRDQLTDFLCRCKDSRLVEMGLLHFAANPSPDNIYCLFKVEKSHHGDVVQQVKSVRSQCQVQVRSSEMVHGQSSGKSTVDSDAELEKRYQEEQEKKRTQRPAYAFKQKEAEAEKLNVKEATKEVVTLVREVIQSRGAYILGVIALVLGVMFYLFFMPGEATDVAGKIGGAIVSGPMTVEGTVEKVNGDVVFFRTLKNNLFVITPQREGFRTPKVRSKLRVSMVPYRQTPDGSYLARIRMIREVEAFTEDGEK